MNQVLSKREVIQMLSTSFCKNQRILSFINSACSKHLRNFFNYVYITTEQTGNIFISKNNSNVLLYVKKSNKKTKIKSILALIRLLVLSASRTHLLSALKINKEVKKIRNTEALQCCHSDYFYIWFLAGNISKRGLSGLYDIKKHLTDISHKSQLPIYIETTVKRMLAIYERAGFSIYAKKQIGNQTIWFAKLEANV